MSYHDIFLDRYPDSRLLVDVKLAGARLLAKSGKRDQAWESLKQSVQSWSKEERTFDSLKVAATAEEIMQSNKAVTKPELEREIEDWVRERLKAGLSKATDKGAFRAKVDASDLLSRYPRLLD